VSRLLDQAIAAGCFSGAVAGWKIGPGDVELVAVGKQSIPDGPAMEARAFFDLASLTKVLVTTTLFLCGSRRLGFSLDSAIRVLLPGPFDSSWLGAITPRQLLCHRSGLPAWKPLYAMVEEGESITSALKRIKAEYEPGTRSVYSCLGFILAAGVIEGLVGAPIDKLFLDWVLSPLGLQRQLSFHPDEDRLVAAGAWPGPEAGMTRELSLNPARLPAGERPEDGNARFLGGPAGNAGLYGCAAGVLRLATEYQPGQGSLLSPEEVRMAISPCEKSLDNSDRRLGWQGARDPGSSAGPGLGDSAFGHSGFTGTSVWSDPERNLSIVLLSHRNHPAFRGVNLHPLRRRLHTLISADCC